jgi:hypothetical protein
VSYKEKFAAALNKSIELGLQVDSDLLPFNRQELNAQERQELLALCSEILPQLGFETSSDLASRCIEVHTTIQSAIKMILGIDSTITIGDIHWPEHNYVYCKTSYERLIDELGSPNHEADIKLHTWLTLVDGSILDCTSQAHADLLFDRGERPIHECFSFIPLNEDNGYTPYLVGSHFLYKIGAIRY